MSLLRSHRLCAFEGYGAFLGNTALFSDVGEFGGRGNAVFLFRHKSCGWLLQRAAFEEVTSSAITYLFDRECREGS